MRKIEKSRRNLDVTTIWWIWETSSERRSRFDASLISTSTDILKCPRQKKKKKRLLENFLEAYTIIQIHYNTVLLLSIAGSVIAVKLFMKPTTSDSQSQWVTI